MRKLSLLIILAITISLGANAQTHAKKGDYSFLKGEKMSSQI